MRKEESLSRRKYRKEGFLFKGEQAVHTLWYFVVETEEVLSYTMSRKHLKEEGWK